MEEAEGLSSRQKSMLALVQEHGYVSIERMAERFGVTAQTIRRDINQLCSAGLLRRYHGGAGLAPSGENITYTKRKVLFQEEKQAIARRIAGHIPENGSVFLDIGTTSEEIARALSGHQGLRVITNNLNVAQLLADCDAIDVLIAGGHVRSRDRGVTGEAALSFVNQFKVDFGILTLSAIDVDGTMLEYDFSEVQLMHAMMRISRTVFLAADRSKFNRSAMVRIGHIGEVDGFFTDREPPTAIRTMLLNDGVEIFLADGLDEALG